MAAARPVILKARKHGRYTKNAIEERNELIRLMRKVDEP